MGYWLVTELKFVTNQTSYITGVGVPQQQQLHHIVSLICGDKQWCPALLVSEIGVRPATPQQQLHYAGISLAGGPPQW